MEEARLGRTLWHVTMSLDGKPAGLERVRCTSASQVTNLWFRVTK